MPYISRLSRLPRPRVLHVGLASVVAVIIGIGASRAAQNQADAPRELDVWAYLLIVTAALALAWWRAWPLAALAGSVVAASAYLLLSYPFGPIQICMVLAMFAVARRHPLARSLPACAIAAAISTTSVIPRLVTQTDSPALALLAWTSWLIVPWSVGALLHSRATAARRSRADLIARTALNERMRLARHVHDAAGHGLAVIAMQAGIAQLVFDEQPDQARESLRAIDQTSRAALAELRDTLRTVEETGTDSSSPSGSAEPTAPVRLGVSGITALVEGVRHAGLDVTLQVDETVASLPLSVAQQTAIYRVVQESLTNVLQHADSAQAQVHIGSAGDGTVIVTHTDSGAGVSGTPGSGRGLAGMRARVETLGGELMAGPAPQGGFAVRAWIPTVEGPDS